MKVKREIGTAWAKVQNCRRYVRMISPNIPLCDLASLNWVSHRVPSSPAYARKQKGKELLVTEVDTHTHTPARQSHRPPTWPPALEQGWEKVNI